LKVQEALSSCGIEPREARLLLAAATGFSEASLIGFPERLLPKEAEQRFAEFTARRGAGEPVAYILGRKEFYGFELMVNPAVLVPRPETELLVDLSLARNFNKVADLGTGSGAIALALKKHRPQARVVAIDSSAAALVVAQRNATRWNVEIEFRHGRWLEGVEESFDLIVSNPPYIAAGDPHLPGLRYEPASALVSGADGLDAIRELARGAPARLAPGGWLLLEHGAGQQAAVRELLSAAGLEEVTSWPDLAGIPRVSGGKRKI
jgi:release factor glutamine methyltransferase